LMLFGFSWILVDLVKIVDFYIAFLFAVLSHNFPWKTSNQ
jgi:hypothetical protein